MHLHWKINHGYAATLSSSTSVSLGHLFLSYPTSSPKDLTEPSEFLFSFEAVKLSFFLMMLLDGISGISGV